MLTWCRVYLLLFLLFFNFGIKICLPKINTNLKLSNVPIRSDLDTFLNVFKRVSKYYRKNLSVIDLSAYFGIFLTNVNLKHALDNKRRRLKGESQLHEIIDLNADIMRHFHVKDRENNKLNNEEKMILKLFSNESEWIKNIDNFTSAKIQERTTEATRYILSDLKSYSDKIQAVDDGVPNPKKSDKCLASLAHGQLNSHGICTIDKSCYEVLANGTNYGYALTHRLLLLQMAHNSRHCSIFSKSEDRYFSNRFCSMLYVEAEFIAIQDFENGFVDLMLEIMCLCGLHGHAQFLNRTWLERIKRFQTPYGCFGLDVKKMEYTFRQEALRWKLYRSRDYDTLEGLCNEHVTSLAMATYAEAVRFILEIYY